MNKFLKIAFVLLLCGMGVLAVANWRPEVLVFLKLQEPTQETVVEVEEDTTEADAEAGRPHGVRREITYASRIKKGLNYAKNGLLDFAAQEFSAAISLNPDDSQAYRELGKVQYQLENWEHAYSNLYLARTKGDDSNETAYLIIRAQMQAGEIEKAKELFAQVDQGGEEEQILYLRGLLALLDEDRSTAGGSFTRLIQLYPETDLAMQVQKYLDAYTSFDLFQDGHPAHLKALLAKALNQNGEYTVAIELLKKALQEKPDYRDGWILFGYAYYARGEYSAARNAWLEAVKIDPTKAESQYFLGLAYANLGYGDEAVEAFDLALENGFEPKLQVISKLAEVYLVNENYTQAAATYEEYLQTGGDNVPDNYVRPIWIYLDHLGTPEDVDKALVLADEVVAKFSTSALAHNLRGWVLIYDENYDEAIQELRKAKQYAPELAAVYLNMGLWYQRQNDLNQAKIYYNTAYEKGGGDSISNTAAQRYNEVLELEKAQM